MRPTDEAFLAIDFATASVTSCPDWLMPSATTPLSAHIIMTAFFEISIFSSPKTAPILAVKSSKSPMPSSGFATESQFERIFLYIFTSGGVIFNFFNSSTVKWSEIILFSIIFCLTKHAVHCIHIQILPQCIRKPVILFFLEAFIA